MKNFLSDFFGPVRAKAIPPMSHLAPTPKPLPTVSVDVDTYMVLLLERAAEGLAAKWLHFPPVNFCVNTEELAENLFLPDWSLTEPRHFGAQQRLSRVTVADVIGSVAILRAQFNHHRRDDGSATVCLVESIYEELCVFCTVYEQFLRWKIAQGDDVSEQYLALFELASVQLLQAVPGKPPA